MLSGEVSLKTAKGMVLMHKGQGTMVYDGKAPTDAAPWPDDRVTRAVATVSFAPSATGAADPSSTELPLTHALQDLFAGAK